MKLRRFLLTLLVLCLTVGAMVMTASAAEIVASGSCGENLTWTMDSEGTLTISGTGDMYDYYYNDDDVAPWYYGYDVQQVIVENGVTSIGDDAFWDCESLTGITIPDSVTSIGDSAFYDCESLTSITIPDSVTSIGDGAFRYCSSLNGITLGEGVTSIGDWTFKDCDSLTSITIPDSVTSIGDHAFDSCSSLTSITLGEGVTSIGEEAFSYCTSLTGITIPDSVTSIGYYAFFECTSLTSITLGEGVTSIGQETFSNCTSLTSITIPDSVTSIGYRAFYCCSKLTSITLGEGVTSIDDGVFNSCNSLSAIYVDSANQHYASVDGVLFNKNKTKLLIYPNGKAGAYSIPAGVTSIGYCAFHDCESLTSITIPDSVTSIGSKAFYECTSLTSITIPDSVTSIGGGTFSYCTSLTSITIPDSVTSIGKKAFSYCTSLTGITIGEGVTSIGEEAFSNCTSLTDITLGEGVTSIGEEAFYKCTSLTSITIPDSVTSIGDWAFKYCDSLSAIYVDSANQHYASVDGVLCSKDKTQLLIYPNGKASAYSVPTGVTSIGDSAFSECTSLTSITIPDSVTSIGDWAFYYCTSLTSITLGDGVTSIGDYAFEDCDSLTSITIPDSVTSIGNDAFWGCSSLTSITLGEGVTSIGDYAFYKCTSLTSITFPKSVKKLGASMFAGYDDYSYSNLEKITFNGDAPTIDDYAFYGVTATAYYPADNSTWTKSMREDYGGDLTWKKYTPAPLSITTQPKTAYAKLGEKAKLTVKAEGDGLTYQWYVKDVGDSKYFLSSIDTPTYSMKMTEANHGRRAYCVITDAYGNSVKTKTVYLRVAASVKTQPKNTYTQKDATAKVKIEAVGDELTYQWYIKNAGAKKYSKSSVTSATYSCKMTDKAKDRYAYCIVTDKYGNTEKTKTVVLRMAATITTQPKTAYAKLGEKAKITVKAVGDELTYQWYVKDVGDSKYFLSSIDTPTYSMKMKESNHGRRAYCVITDAYGNSVKTKTVYLRVAASIKTQPKSVTVAEGKTAKVILEAVGDELTYTWYIKNEGASKFSKSSVTKATYSCKMSEKADGRQAYCVVTDKYGKTVKSNTVTLKMK